MVINVDSLRCSSPSSSTSVYLHEFFFSTLIFHSSIHFFPLYAERLKRSVGKYCERKDFESSRRVILMADTTPLDGGFVLHEGGGIPNDSLYQIVIRTPRNRQGSLNFGNLRARRKRSGRAMIEDDGRRGKKEGCGKEEKTSCKKLSSLNTTISICLAIKRFYGRRVEDSSSSPFSPSLA